MNASIQVIAVGLLLAIASSAFAHPGHEDAGSFDSRFAAAENREDRSGSDETTNRVSITVEGDFRFIRANGMPNHETGAFPNRNNPNHISAQNYAFRVPVKPAIAAKPTVLVMQPFGVAVNGVVFDPFAAEWWQRDRESGWQYEPMVMEGKLGADQNNAHVQPQGAYHYHSIPIGLISKLTNGKAKMTLIGWSADGFPMYGPSCFSEAKNMNSTLKNMKSSYRVKKGTRPSGPGGNYDGSFVADYEFVKDAGDLDECNGRFGMTPEFPQGTYYYVVTENFPFIPRLFKGTPDPSFMRHGPPPGRGGPRPPGRPDSSRADATSSNPLSTGQKYKSTLQPDALRPEHAVAAHGVL